jgi:hypothetical protein
LVRDIKIYDLTESVTAKTLDAKPLLYSDVIVYDPIQGIIPGVAEEEIWYKLEFDPAYYNSGTNINSIGLDWGEDQVGRLWWDMTTTRFLQYYTDDILDYDERITSLNTKIDAIYTKIRVLSLIDRFSTEITELLEKSKSYLDMITSRKSDIEVELQYRKNNWGSLAPNSSIDIYEWTKSYSIPTDWATKVTAGSQPDVYNGEVLNSNSPNWVQKTEWNYASSCYVPVYYFWVKDQTVIPSNIDFRKISARDVSLMIANPEKAGIAWTTPISEQSFILQGISQFLNSTSSIQFRIARTDSEIPKHSEWALMRDGDAMSVPTFELWDKLIQSITSHNNNGDQIPSTKRYITDRVGYDVEHGQSLFRDLTGVRKHLVQYLNTLFAGILMVDDRRNLSILIRILIVIMLPHYQIRSYTI